MIFVCFFLSGVVLLLAVSLLYTARYFLQREARLVDRLLKQAHVAPVQIERENVVKLPDPEIQPETWIDAAFFEDDVKEELEHVYPEASRMSHTQARTIYAKDWASIERRLREQRTPLRADR